MSNLRPSPPAVLFSASKTLHQPGAVLTGDSPFYTYLETRVAAASTNTDNPLEVRSRQIVKGTYDVEQIFHSACPADRASRKTARFACSSLEDCLVYAFEQHKAPFYVYEVEMPDAMPAPMALTGYARKNAQNGPLVQALATEYWEPTRPWNYFEFLGSSMKVLKSGTQFAPPFIPNEEVALRRKLYDEDATNVGKIVWLPVATP